MSNWPVLMRTYRKENGLKQDALAYQLNVDQTTISRWERGIDKPSLAMQKRLRDLLWKREDSVLDAAIRMVKSSFGREAIIAPGTTIVEVSKSQAEKYNTYPIEMRGKLMRDFYGNDYYERYMLPLGELGIYSGDVARMDLIAKINIGNAAPKYSHSSIIPIISNCGIYAVSQSRYVSKEYAASRPELKIYRFDELVG